jgi:restriction system-associated AAA family ATPase
MKIRRVKITDIEYKPLMKGLELSFDKQSEEYVNANCLIGINGSGKSQFIELIAEIFLFLDRLYRKTNTLDNERSAFAFEIEYEISLNGTTFLVVFNLENINGKKKDLVYKIFNFKNKQIEVKEDEIYKFLPKRIVGYTSGENETISVPFYSYYDVYADYTGKRALSKYTTKEDYEPRFNFMNYSTNLGIVISNLLFENDINGLEYIKKRLKISSLKRFQLIIQTCHSAAPNKNKGGVILTHELEDWKSKLIACSTTHEYDDSDKRYVLDFIVNKATKEAFKSLFNSALELYTALYKLELLNNLIIDKKVREKVEKERRIRKLVAKMPEVPDKDKVLHYSELKLELTNGQIVDYLSLSDGEHQYFNIFGTILMINQENSLFLLDEPETHFNPMWRRYFLSTLKEITKNRKQDLFVTSHSPFIVSDSKKENVYIFRRENKDQISIDYPNRETYGASYDEILQMAFGIDVPISEDSLKLIDSLKKETDYEKIEVKIQELGQSYQLMSLYRRVEMLKSTQKK